MNHDLTITTADMQNIDKIHNDGILRSDSQRKILLSKLKLCRAQLIKSDKLKLQLL